MATLIESASFLVIALLTLAIALTTHVGRCETVLLYFIGIALGGLGSRVAGSWRQRESVKEMRRWARGQIHGNHKT